MIDDFETEVLQRLARLEESVTNHIPSRINDIQQRLATFERHMWALIVLMLGHAITIIVMLARR